MIIYHVPEADAGERWLPTQVQANACAKAYKTAPKMVHAGEDGRDGMCAMLNQAEMEIGERTGDEAAPMTREEIVNSNTPEAQAAAKQLMDPDRVAKMRLTDVEEFIQAADLVQMASLAQNVCWRMKELLKPVAVND